MTPNPILVAKENVPLVVDNIATNIASVLESYTMGEFSARSLVENLVAGHAQLWLHVEGRNVAAWAVTEIAVYKDLKRLRFMLMGGKDMNDWLDDIDYITAWSKQFGCSEVELWVRPGLRKKLEKFGFRKTYEVVTKRINNGALQ